MSKTEDVEPKRRGRSKPSADRPRTQGNADDTRQPNNLVLAPIEQSPPSSPPLSDTRASGDTRSPDESVLDHIEQLGEITPPPDDTRPPDESALDDIELTSPDSPPATSSATEWAQDIARFLIMAHWGKTDAERLKGIKNLGDCVPRVEPEAVMRGLEWVFDHDKNKNCRKEATLSLKRIRGAIRPADPAGQTTLTEVAAALVLAPDTAVEDRRQAATVLGRIAGEGQLNYLCNALWDPDPQVQLAALSGVQRLTGEKFLAEALQNWQVLQRKKDQSPPNEDSLQPPKETIEAALSSHLRELIPGLPTAVADRADAVLALHQSLNRTFRRELRDEVIPLLQSILQEDIPDDYEGKRARAVQVNGLLSLFDLAIQIQDEQGAIHVCGLQHARARESDKKGSLRLRERTSSGSSQKGWSFSSVVDIQIIDISRDESRTQPTRGGWGR